MKRLFILTVSILFSAGFLFAQIQDPSANETNSSVPELESMHSVIYPLWHTAWPAKNIPLLISLVPKLDSLTAHLSEAKLPGILRDREVAWKLEMGKLQSAVSAYQTAADGHDSIALLQSAERVHSLYESLVSVVRPPLRALDEFHKVLYVLYHYNLPEKNLPKISESMSLLQIRMDSLNIAVLPKSKSALQGKFVFKRTQLSDAVAKVVKGIRENQPIDQLEPSIRAMHSRYEELDALLR